MLDFGELAVEKCRVITKEQTNNKAKGKSSHSCMDERPENVCGLGLWPTFDPRGPGLLRPEAYCKNMLSNSFFYDI